MNSDGKTFGPEWLSFHNKDSTKQNLSASADHDEVSRSCHNSPRVGRLSPHDKTPPLKYTRSKSTSHLFGELPAEQPKSDVFTILKERSSFDKNFPTLNNKGSKVPPVTITIPNSNIGTPVTNSPKEKESVWRAQATSNPTSPLLSNHNHLVFAPSSTSLTSSISNSNNNNNVSTSLSSLSSSTPSTPTTTSVSSSTLSPVNSLSLSSPVSSPISPTMSTYRSSLVNSSESNDGSSGREVRSPSSSFSVLNPNFNNSNPNVSDPSSDSMSMDHLMRGLLPSNQPPSNDKQKPSLLNRTRAELLVPPSKKVGSGGGTKIIPPFVKFNPPTFRKSTSEPTLPLSPAYEEKYAKLMATQKKTSIAATSKLKESYFENYDNIQTKPRTPSSSSTGSSGSSDRNDFFLNLLNQEEQKKKKLEGDQSDAEQSSFLDQEKVKSITSEEDEEKFLRNLGWVPEEEDHVPELTEDEIKDLINGADKMRIPSPTLFVNGKKTNVSPSVSAGGSSMAVESRKVVL